MPFSMTRLRIWLLFSHFVMSDFFPLSKDFPRQEHWSGLLFPSPGDLPTQAFNPCFLHCRQILYHWATWEAPGWEYYTSLNSDHILKTFLFGCAGSLLPCLQASSRCGEQGLFPSCGAQASHCGGFSFCGAQAVGSQLQVHHSQASVVMVHRPSCLAACGIFPDLRSNPCPPHRQVDC